VHEVLDRLRGRAMAVLLTTHDLLEAETLADRVAIMKEGRIVALGTARELVHGLYGAQRELSVRLAAEPAPAAREALAAAGLLPTAAPDVFTGSATDDLAALERLRALLVVAGAAIESLQLREAGLHGVYLRLTGEEPGA
jgi:ABC-2 type transport system ATP-binding protein